MTQLATWKELNELMNKQGVYLIAMRHTAYYLDNKLHRINGPAIEHANGDKYYFQEDKLHRIDGPAVESADGYKEYYLDGKLHRIDGPAVESADGYKEYYLDGVKFSEQEYFSKCMHTYKW